MNAFKGYQLLERLGSGVGGDVYLAEAANGRVAIRQFCAMPESDSLARETDRGRFLDTGRAVMVLHHPAIVPVHEVVDDQPNAFIIMEYEEGQTLETALSARRFSPEAANEILSQVAWALDFAHERGIVHGDLKPSDVFLVPRHGARVSDFGTSPRARRDLRGPISASLVHEYLSPEHLRDRTSIAARSDQYSLAAIAYRMYTGHAPSAQKPEAAGGATRLDQITPPSRIDPDLPTQIDAPFLRALDQNPERRFDSCVQFVGALGAALIAPAVGPASAQRRGMAPAAIYVALGLIPILAVAALLYTKREGVENTIAVSTTPLPAPAGSPPIPTGPVRTAPSGPEKRNIPPKKHTPFVDAPKPRLETQTPPIEANHQPPPPPGPLAKKYAIEVFARDRSIGQGLSFGFNDPAYGELGEGDLRARVSAIGRVPARARYRLEWALNGVTVDSHPISLQQPVAYGNQPTTGAYQVTLKLDGRPISVLKFTITP